MFEGAKVAVVVPAYNEAERIEKTLRTIPSWVDCLVVVDDGSTDGTADRAGDSVPAALVLRHRENRGVGAAIASGYEIAFASGADVVAVMAGDGQMDPAELDRILRPVARGHADYCKGDRLGHPDTKRVMPLSRYIGNHVLSRLTSLALGARVRDSQCGYTALSRSGAEMLSLSRLWPGYGYPNDLLGLVRNRGLRIAEVAVRPIYEGAASGVRFRHAVVTIPYLLARAWWRRPRSRKRHALPRLRSGAARTSPS